MSADNTFVMAAMTLVKTSHNDDKDYHLRVTVGHETHTMEYLWRAVDFEELKKMGVPVVEY